MNIMYASDDNYVEIAAVSIVSLLENNKDVDGIKFFILDNGISDENKEILSSLVEKYSKEIVFIHVPDIEKLAGMKLDVGFWALPIFARLFSASLLPEEIEKIIYLDCDTMIRSSILPMWNEDLGENLIGGCADGIPAEHKECIFLKTTDIYVNSGILLINLKAWREKNAEQKFLNFLKLFKGKLSYPDQDVINGVFRNHIKLIPQKYNAIAFYHNYNPELLYYADIERYCSKQELEEAANAPVIVHFAGQGRKPWTRGNENMYKQEYIKYRNMTVWADKPLREGDSSAPAKAEITLPEAEHRIREKAKIAEQMRPLIQEAKTKLKESEISLQDCLIK